jgi:uncharacterized protein (DUF169 family)
MNLLELRSAAEECETILRLQTYPLAVKMLKNGEEIPKGAKRPVKDLGYHLSTCQLFAMVRRQGIALAQLMEDMWCVQPVVGYGLAETPSYFMDGKDRFATSARTPDAGKTWAKAFPRLEAGKYVGVVAAPAKAASFEPDLIMIYCDPSQLTQLLSVKNWLDGLDVTSTLSGHAACVYAVVPTLLTGQWQVTVPCPGDRAMGLARHDEMIVSLPATALPDAVTGLAYAHEHGHGLPIAPTMSPEYKMEEAYVKIGNLMGMDWLK